MEFYCPDDSNNVTAFTHYHFLVEADGFKSISGYCKDDFVKSITTWRAVMTTLEFNLIEDGSFGMSSLTYNKE
jgi:hypothetical protein